MTLRDRLPKPPSEDWWERRRQIRTNIVSLTIQTEELLFLFDDMQLITKETASLALLRSGTPFSEMQRYFEPLPGDEMYVQLRQSPPSGPGAEGFQSSPSPSFQIMCPRGELLHRMCVDQELYDMREAVIRGFQSMESLLLPYGRPSLSTDGNHVLLPAILQRGRCAPWMCIAILMPSGMY